MSQQPKTFVYSSDAIPPLPVFSQAVVSKGMIYVSGNIGCDHNWNIVPGGVGKQTTAALENIAKVLSASGASLEDIVKVNVYLTNFQRDFPLMNEAYAQFFDSDAMPARTCVGVAELPRGAGVEIECIAEASR